MLDLLDADDMLFRKVARQQHAGAQAINAARNSAREGMNKRESPFVEAGIVLPADMLEPVFDVGTRLVRVERPEVKRGDYPLAQLLHPGAAHELAQLGLPDEKALQQRAFVLQYQGHQVCFYSRNDARLVMLAHRESEGRGDCAQQIVGIELRGHQMCRYDLAGIKLSQQVPDQRRLACTNLTRECDESFTLVQAVLQVGVRAPVASAAVEERRVRTELEGLAGEAVEG